MAGHVMTAQINITFIFTAGIWLTVAQLSVGTEKQISFVMTVM